jgi:hypothetical protein
MLEVIHKYYPILYKKFESLQILVSTGPCVGNFLESISFRHKVNNFILLLITGVLSAN